MHSDPKDEKILVGAAIGKSFTIYDFKKKKIEQKVFGHEKTPHMAYWVDDGKRALSSDSRAETICWDTSNWSIIFRISGNCTLIYYPHFNIGGLFHDNKVKVWSSVLCCQLQKEYQLQELVSKTNVIIVEGKGKDEEKISEMGFRFVFCVENLEEIGTLFLDSFN